MDEIIIEKRTRAVLIALSLFGLLVFGPLCYYSWEMITQRALTITSLSFFLFFFSMVIFLVWGLIASCSSRNYLETSAEGIIFGGYIRCYCTWSNVKDVVLVKHDSVPYATADKVYVEFHSANDLLFDSALYRILARCALQHNRIGLMFRSYTSVTAEEVHERLWKRWQRGMEQKQESRV